MKKGLFLLALPILALQPVQAADYDKFLALGTGTTSGVYYPVGRGICDQVNDRRLEHGVRCTAYSTGGSAYNVQALTTGELDLAITRADIAYSAYRGTGLFMGLDPSRNLRAVSNLYEMPIAVLVKGDGPVRTFGDLPGHRLNVGTPGSGTPAVVDTLLEAGGWDRSDFSRTLGLSTVEMGDAFCNDEVDIIVEIMGVPSAFYERMTRECGGRFLPLPLSIRQRILKNNPFFRFTEIPGGLYPHNREAVPTLSSDAMLITAERVHPRSVYVAAEAIFSNPESFRGIHAALSACISQKMVSANTFLPFHQGARSYFADAGLVCVETPAEQ